MISDLKFEDVLDVLLFLRKQHELFNYSEKEAFAVDHSYGTQLVGKAHTDGCSFVYRKDGKITGVALSYILPNIWIPAHKELHMLAIVADTPIAGGKLFYNWEKRATSWLDNGYIKRILVDSIPVSKGINYGKLGFHKVRETYAKER